MNLPAKQGGLDITFSVMALIIIILLFGFLLDLRPTDAIAHLWGRLLGAGQEDACPTGFGNAFWFACASEVRSLS